MGGDIIIFDVLSLDGEAKEGERERGREGFSIYPRSRRGVRGGERKNSWRRMRHGGREKEGRKKGTGWQVFSP